MNINKSLAVFQVVGIVSAGLLLANTVGAQTVVGGSAGTGVGVAASGTLVNPGIYPTPAPPPYPVPPPATDSGFIQFNNLTVQSVSATNPPAEIIATNNIYPMMGAAGTGSAAGGSMMSGQPTQPNIVQPNQPTNPSQPTSICLKYETQSDSAGAAIACPLPPTSKYRIEVDASTRLLLRDRTTANLSDFASGDQINVFGYYNTDGSIQAYLIRDISKPVEMQTLQLNNVSIVSVSGTSIPATIVVGQEEGSPCYGFGASGAKSNIMCPMGAAATFQNTSMRPNSILYRQYTLHIDANTVILDRNRTQLSLASLKIGDQLNVYGETSDNGLNINADIVRDISIPPMASDYSGSVTQVNNDGSFVIQLDNGKTITVQSPIAVGARVTVHGLLDSTSNTLSQISQISIGNAISTPPTPMPTPVPLYNGGGSSSSGNGTSSPVGMHCGGFIANAPTCPSGYHCKLNIIADTGGVCVAN